MTDAELYRELRRGDEQAFTTLYRRCSPAVYRFALRMSGDPALADEAVQEVFAALIHKPDLFDPARGELRSYLFGAARNVLRQRFAVAGRDAPLEEAYPDGDPAGGETPLEGLTRDERVATVRRAVLSLPEPYRAAVVLCDLNEVSYAAAAQHLDIALGTVRSRLYRGRALLERKLATAPAVRPPVQETQG